MIPIGTDLSRHRFPVVTFAIIIVNSVLYFSGFSSTAYVLNLFSHSDFHHLFWNMLFLWIFGSYLEDRIGRLKFLLHYFILYIGSEVFWELLDGSPSVGASGAISGVMGLYLFRLYYSKIKTAIGPIFIYYLKINIDARLLLLFWFGRDLYDAFYSNTIVAYWSHVGGFLTGMCIGLYKRHHLEAQKEHLYARARKAIDAGTGLAAAQRDLLALIKLDPVNPAPYLDLARLSAEREGGAKEARRLYLEAARLQYSSRAEKSRAGQYLLEYLDRFREPVDTVMHMKYSSALANVCDYAGAARILEYAVEGGNLKTSLGERLFHNYIEYSVKAGQRERAEYALLKFREAFPSSHLIKSGEALMQSPVTSGPDYEEALPAARENWLGSLLSGINGITADPFFLTLFLISIGISIIIPEGLEEHQFILYLAGALLTAFGSTALLRGLTSFAGSIYSGAGSRSQASADREFHMRQLMDRAILCERKEQYSEALNHLESYLREDMDNLEARYRLARILHRHLNKPSLALAEYRKLFNAAPPGHPYKRDAYDHMKELSVKPAE